MVKKNKKLLISFWVAIAVIIGLIVALVSVIAAYNATAESKFKVTYSAAGNIKAEITGNYVLADGTTTKLIVDGTENDEVIAFGETDASANVTAKYKDTEEIRLNADNLKVTFNYLIKNTDTEVNGTYIDSFALTLNFQTEERSNIAVKCSVDGGEFVVLEAGQTTIGNVAYTDADGVSIAIEISIQNVAEGANCEGTFAFGLAQ